MTFFNSLFLNVEIIAAQGVKKGNSIDINCDLVRMQTLRPTLDLLNLCLQFYRVPGDS